MSILDPFIYSPKNINLLTKLHRYFYKIVKHTSSGTITYYLDNEPLFLMLRVGNNEKFEWIFPKGWVESSDKSLEARAVTETREEAGINVEIKTKLIGNDYTYYLDEKKQRVEKHVHYFLAESKTTDVDQTRYNPDVDEAKYIKELKWFPYKIALTMTRHDREKKILTAALEQL